MKKNLETKRIINIIAKAILVIIAAIAMVTAVVFGVALTIGSYEPNEFIETVLKISIFGNPVLLCIIACLTLKKKSSQKEEG